VRALPEALGAAVEGEAVGVRRKGPVPDGVMSDNLNDETGSELPGFDEAEGVGVPRGVDEAPLRGVLLGAGVRLLEGLSLELDESRLDGMLIDEVMAWLVLVESRGCVEQNRPKEAWLRA
jgi:hypothetical protein